MPLPEDVVFEILKWCEYRSVISIRLISKGCFEMTTIRLIWVLLVRDYINANNQTRIRYIVERPISTYTTSELELLVKRWAKAECAWLNLSGRSPMFASRQFKLHSPSFGLHPDISTSFLVPGGRYFIEFGIDASALYYDLDSDTPSPLFLIYPVTGRFVQDMTIFKPCVISTADNLSFHTGVCFLDSQHDRWTITLWRICLSSTSSDLLHAEQTVSFFFEHPAYATLYMEAMDLSSDQVGLYSSLSPQAGRDEPPCRAVTVLKWPEIVNHTGDFERRVIYVAENFTEVNILPQQFFLAHSRTQTLLIGYHRSPVYTRTPTINELLSGFNHLRATRNLWPDFYKHLMTPDNESIFSPPFVTQLRQNQNAYTVVHQTSLVGLNDNHCIPCAVEIRFQDNALPTEPPHVRLFDRVPASIGSCMDSRKLFTPPYGYRNGLLQFDENEMKFRVYMTKDDEFCLEPKGSVRLGSHRRRIGGIIHSIDEGTGRILMYNPKTSQVSVFDFVDRE
ncbi:hypothetical protein D9619_011124 [Psilocybe cf. subviscida]|uniref:F-box domain-containing protein n=1 Tax=Psilocybe cf. subviscida TaxID=2480587 RepID=A0A8H5BJM0_9AGAR|nr:hypothetical protein D9619_011124 [Psilocybe cf. subviscida]